MSFVISPGVIQTPLTAGGVAYGTGTQAKVTAAGTSGLPLISAGANVPIFAALSAAGGGTGLTSPGASGNVLTSNGTGWTSSASAAGGSFTATASGSISAGAPVLINSSGQAIVQTNTVSSLTNGVSFFTGTSSNFSYAVSNFHSSYQKWALNTNDGSQVVFWNGSGTNFLLGIRQTINATGTVQTGITGQSTVNPGSYTMRWGGDNWGISELVFSPTTGYYYYVNARSGAGTPANQAKICVVNFNQTSGSTVTGYDLGNGAYASSPGISDAQNYEMAISSNEKLAIAWMDSSNNLYCCVATLTASAPHFVWGTMLTINSGGTLNSSQTHMGVAWNSNNNEFVVTYATSASRVTASLISVSGTTCTLQSTSSVASADYTSSWGRHSVCFVSTANRYIFAFYTDASATGAASPDYAYVVAASSSGTALTYGTPLQLSQETDNTQKNLCFVYSTPVVANYFFVATGLSSSQTKYLTYASVSGTTITTLLGPTQVLGVGTTSSGNPGYGAFGYNPNLGTVVDVASSGSSGAGASITIDNTYRYSSNQSNNFAGFSSAAYTNGQTATINCVSSTNTLQSSLTTGVRYYLQLSGILAPQETTNYAGQALSASSILVKG